MMDFITLSKRSDMSKMAKTNFGISSLEIPGVNPLLNTYAKNIQVFEK